MNINQLANGQKGKRRMIRFGGSESKDKRRDNSKLYIF